MRSHSCRKWAVLALLQLLMVIALGCSTVDPSSAEKSGIADSSKESGTGVNVTSVVWSYEDLGFHVQFVDGMLITAAQWKGGISHGIMIGDTKQSLAELGIPVERGVVSQAVAYIDQEVGVIEVHLEGDRVIRFVYGPGPESDL